MTLQTLLLSPEQEGYAPSFPAEATATMKDSPAYAVGLGIRNGARSVPVSFLTRESDGSAQYFRAFYQTAMGEGSLPFLLSLRIDTSAIAVYRCILATESLTMINVEADVYLYSMQLYAVLN